jgi:hypothetical protein
VSSLSSEVESEEVKVLKSVSVLSGWSFNPYNFSEKPKMGRLKIK